MYKFLDAHAQMFLESDKYKTIDKYGRKGMWMHKAHREALRLYAEILKAAPDLVSATDPDRKYFLQVQPVSIQSCLKSVSKDCDLKDKPLKVNLSRAARLTSIRRQLRDRPPQVRSQWPEAGGGQN